MHVRHHCMMCSKVTTCTPGITIWREVVHLGKKAFQEKVASHKFVFTWNFWGTLRSEASSQPISNHTGPKSTFTSRFLALHVLVQLDRTEERRAESGLCGRIRRWHQRQQCCKRKSNKTDFQLWSLWNFPDRTDSRRILLRVKWTMAGETFPSWIRSRSGGLTNNRPFTPHQCHAPVSSVPLATSSERKEEQ